MKRIALVEDDFDIRESLRNQFANSSRIELEFETDSLEKALLYYRTRPAPHLFLMDINLTGMSGIDGMPVLKRHFPDSIILIHSIMDDDDLVFQAICRGAAGYLLKTTPHEELEKHILVALEEGGSPISPSIARRILNHFSQGKQFIPLPRQNQLTDTERSIVSMMVDAMTYQEIAEKLGMTIDGVRYYVKKIYQKLQINSRGQLIRLFIDNPF